MSTFASPAGTEATQLQAVVRRAYAATPRHSQRWVGPSEMGEECDRRLVYRLLDLERVNTVGDPWPSIVGTAVHAWLADAFSLENQRLGRVRYLVEQRVWVTDGISGSADLYDVDLGQVIDHKILGTTSMRSIKSGEIPTRYRVQLQLYGYALRRAGYKVDRVTMACYPRGGFLDGLYLWTVDYDEKVALDALDRFGRLTSVAVILKLDEPGSPFWSLIPHLPDPVRCTWCPFWRPGKAADTSGCPGPT